MQATNAWRAGPVPIAVVMITLNEAHNLSAILENLRGWASEVYLLDSYSSDKTVDIALEFGVGVKQKKFLGFGDQWNSALKAFPIRSPWTMKLDPDERLTPELKSSIARAIVQESTAEAYTIKRRLWFMGKPLNYEQRLIRIWRTGRCQFSNVTVNEHPLIDGETAELNGLIEHLDSPTLEHWLEKQNKYSSAEARRMFDAGALSDSPKLFGSKFQRRMWAKAYFYRIPGRYFLLTLYYLFWQGLWRSGFEGLTFATLRVFVMRLRYAKFREMQTTGLLESDVRAGRREPDARVEQL